MDNGTIVYWEGNKLRNTHLFSPAAKAKIETGQYCPHPRGSIGYSKFWAEERRRCIEGYQVGEVKITGYNYFFLNYFPIDTVLNPKEKASPKVRTLPRFMKAQFDFFNLVDYAEKEGKHICLLKTRGAGVSEMCASMGARDFTFSYASPAGKKHHKLFYFASEAPYLDTDGILDPKCWGALEYLSKETQGAFKHFRQKKDQSLHKRASWVDKQNNETQTGGEVIGRVIDRVDKVRGARGYKLFFEEAGAFPNLEKAIEIARPLIDQGGVITGTIIIWGTSNESSKGIEGLKNVFNNPDAYNVLKFKNIWENDNLDFDNYPKDPFEYMAKPGEKGVAWFLPRYELMDRFMDDDGNPDRQAAYNYIEEQRKVREGTPAHEIFVADNPFFPSEALRKVGTCLFNSAKIGKQLIDIETDVISTKPEKGNLYWTHEDGTNIRKGVVWEPDPKGEIEIIEHPQRTDRGEPYINLYVGGIDSIDKGLSDSSSEGGSDFCILIKKRIIGTTGNMYVCKYKDRPYDSREAYDNALKILIYYNCNVNLEDSKTNIISYFRERKAFNKLIKRPRIARSDKQHFRKTNLIGTQPSPKMIQHFINLIRDYVEDYSHNLFFKDMLEELRDYDYDNKTKFDIVAAMGMCEIYDEELTQYAPKEENTLDDEWQDIGWYTDNSGYMKYGVIPNTTTKDGIQWKTI